MFRGGRIRAPYCSRAVDSPEARQKTREARNIGNILGSIFRRTLGGWPSSHSHAFSDITSHVGDGAEMIWYKIIVRDVYVKVLLEEHH